MGSRADIVRQDAGRHGERMAGPTRDAARDDTAQRRRGRPQRLPHDSVPSDRAQIDDVSRTAWLLATTRILSPATSAMSRAQFVTAARDRGIALDSSRLSRWESGTTAVPAHLVAAYEELAQVPRGSLRATSLMLQRLGRGARLAQVPDAADEAEVDDLFTRALDGVAPGDAWLDLATELTRFERVYIPTDAWGELCTRLVNELTRSTGVSLVRRYEAAAVLMQHPTARRHLTRCLGVLIMDPDVQNAGPAVALLSEIDDEAAAELVIRLIDADHRPLKRATLSVAASMGARDLLPASSHRAIESAVSSELQRGSGHMQAVIELVSQLPDAYYERVVSTMPDPSLRSQITLARVRTELVPQDVARSVAETVAGRAEAAHQRAAHDPDQMLRKLVREGLFHAGRDRRYLAASMISVSPYAAGASRALLDLTGDRNHLVASRAWAMLGRFSHSVDRKELGSSAVAQRSSMRARAYQTLGLVDGTIEDDVADRLLHDATDAPDRTLRHSATFALGMAGHPHLQTVAAHHEPAVRDAGRWWSAMGPAVVDDDTGVMSR